MIHAHRVSDVAKLDRLLATDLTDRQREAFEGMDAWLRRGVSHVLTPPQRAWVDDAYRRLELDAGDVENLFSSGRVAIGRPVETPAVLQSLPKRPPSRKAQ